MENTMASENIQATSNPDPANPPQKNYRTAPLKTNKMPPGISNIVGNEAAERFSFYGMRSILVIFMTKYLMDANGNADVMTEAEAQGYFHMFVSAVYFLPFFGALLSDAVLGKYRTIIALSIIYCLGHFALALDTTRMGLLIGLSLIAIGSGGIKPCVSAHVGDQFGETNKHLIERVFGWFYFSINFGSFFSYLLVPWLLEHYGPHVAFGVPGLFMALATLVFWMGRYKFAHVPPAGKGFIKEALFGEGVKSMARLFIIYLFVAFFWSLYDQTGSSWVLQAKDMDRQWMGITWLSSQIQAFNPILILILIPVSTFYVYPAINKFYRLTPLRKIGLGMFLSVFSFLVVAWIEWRIELGETPNISWQLLAFAIITAAEILVSITCLEFSYTQAPNSMKSFVMAFYLLSISFGNIFTSLVNYYIQDENGMSRFTEVQYFLFFAGVMFIASLCYVVVASFYTEKVHVQKEVAV
jgi:proton-dependent oligopeptide transporter, POT family